MSTEVNVDTIKSEVVTGANKNRLNEGMENLQCSCYFDIIFATKQCL